jgi:hypothetical protein
MSAWKSAFAAVWLAATASSYGQAEPPSLPDTCTYDRSAMLSLDQNAFDQDPVGGWRSLAAHEECLAVAADLIRDYREHRNSEDTILYWHEGQVRAMAGMESDAIPLFEKSLKSPEQDPFGWNHYVRATISFLAMEREALLTHRGLLSEVSMPANIQFPKDESGEPVPFSWPPNLDVVDRLIACFGKSYKEAYGTCQE